MTRIELDFKDCDIILLITYDIYSKNFIICSSEQEMSTVNGGIINPSIGSYFLKVLQVKLNKTSCIETIIQDAQKFFSFSLHLNKLDGLLVYAVVTNKVSY